jgi:Tol biopolymer transport system component
MNKTSKFAALGVLFLSVRLAALGSGYEVGVIAQYPSPSPNGSQFVFSADFDRAARLWVAGIDGSGLRKISRTVASSQGEISELEPAWSPDGRRIAYVSHTASTSTSQIWLVQADGTYAAALTAGSGNNSSPAWSPDGSKIAFISNRAGSRDVWFMNADGSGQRRVTTLPEHENSPSFSPGGDRLIFSYSNTNDGSATLWTVNIDGSSLMPVTTGASRDNRPNWGPRGIVFSSNRNSPSGRSKIWAVQPDGSNLRRIGDVTGHDPMWLPDGDLLFTDEGTGGGALTTMSRLRTATGSREVVVDIQGYIHPIDIRPGKATNRVNPISQGRIEVAILSTPEVDAMTSIDTASITFGAKGGEQSLAFCDKKFRDVNADGRLDLTCRFATRAGQFKANSTDGVLRFKTIRGVPFEGRNPIVIVSDEDSDDLK